MYSLTKTRFRGGVWEGLLVPARRGAPPPGIAVTLNDAPVRGVVVVETGRGWMLQVPVPVEAVGDGVQTFLILDAGADRLLGSFAVSGGEAGEDLRSELALLRAELDLLKGAFRRHCRETAQSPEHLRVKSA